MTNRPIGVPSGDLTALPTALGGSNVVREPGYVEFDIDDTWIVATAKDGATRLRIRANLAQATPDQVHAWVDRQPSPRSGSLQVIAYDDGSVGPRLVFERPVSGNSWSTDPLAAEIRSYATAWKQRSLAVSQEKFSILDDPRVSPPSSAWLLLGDQASYPDQEELDDLRIDGETGIFPCLWTAAKQTLPGDLALVYFVTPHKSAHFVTRAASSAFFARDIEVNAVGKVADEQRWAYFTPLIEIEPVPFATLKKAVGGHLILKGRSGKFLRPETIASLHLRARYPRDQAELDRVFVTPTGLAELPPAAEVDIHTWSSIAAGALTLEVHVSTYIVEPLLRHVLNGTLLTWRGEYRLRTGWVDFVITNPGGTPVAAIEVKLATVEPPTGDWSTSKDFLQLRRYMDELAVPGILIDAHRVLLVEHGASQPHRDIPRRTAGDSDLSAIRAHLSRAG